MCLERKIKWFHTYLDNKEEQSVTSLKQVSETGV